LIAADYRVYSYERCTVDVTVRRERRWTSSGATPARGV
jgi:hypothetical protein